MPRAARSAQRNDVLGHENVLQDDVVRATAAHAHGAPVVEDRDTRSAQRDREMQYSRAIDWIVEWRARDQEIVRWRTTTEDLAATHTVAAIDALGLAG